MAMLPFGEFLAVAADSVFGSEDKPRADSGKLPSVRLLNMHGRVLLTHFQKNSPDLLPNWLVTLDVVFFQG